MEDTVHYEMLHQRTLRAPKKRMQLKVDVSTLAGLGLGIGLDISCLSFLDLEPG